MIYEAIIEGGIYDFNEAVNAKIREYPCSIAFIGGAAIVKSSVLTHFAYLQAITYDEKEPEQRHYAEQTKKRELEDKSGKDKIEYL